MFFHSLTLLSGISPRWGAVCLLLVNMKTLFFHRSYFPVIIYFYMLLMTIMLLFWYSPLQRVQIHQRMRFQIRKWLILLERKLCRLWNKKMLRCMITLIIAVSRSIKLMMKLHLCLMPLKKLLETNYTYIYLTQPMAK